MVRCGPYPAAGPRGPLVRSSRTDRGPQALPPACATVPPWLPAKSARVSNLPACCVLGPLVTLPSEPAHGRLARVQGVHCSFFDRPPPSLPPALPVVLVIIGHFDFAAWNCREK